MSARGAAHVVLALVPAALLVVVATHAAHAEPDRALRTLETALPAQWRTARIVIDAGHGAAGNHGTEDAFCEHEEEHTKRTQDAVAAWLAQQPGVEVKRTRTTDAPVSYAARMKQMNAWRADAVIAVHSDARAADEWWRDAETGCWRSRGGNGFAVLYSDEGDAAIVKKRRALAATRSRALRESWMDRSAIRRPRGTRWALSGNEHVRACWCAVAFRVGRQRL